MPIMLILILNTIVCIIGALGGAFLSIGSIISIANMQVPWAVVLLWMTLLVPVMFVVSGIGGWVLFALRATQWLGWIIALPWGFAVLFVLAMLATFQFLA
nr:hypothetical protein [Oscillochloris trichoides]